MPKPQTFVHGPFWTPVSELDTTLFRVEVPAGCKPSKKLVKFLRSPGVGESIPSPAYFRIDGVKHVAIGHDRIPKSGSVWIYEIWCLACHGDPPFSLDGEASRSFFDRKSRGEETFEVDGECVFPCGCTDTYGKVHEHNLIDSWMRKGELPLLNRRKVFCWDMYDPNPPSEVTWTLLNRRLLQFKPEHDLKQPWTVGRYPWMVDLVDRQVLEVAQAATLIDLAEDPNTKPSMKVSRQSKWLNQLKLFLEGLTSPLTDAQYQALKKQLKAIQAKTWKPSTKDLLRPAAV